MCTGSKTNNTNNLRAIYRYFKVQKLNTATLMDCSTNSALILFTQLPALDSVNCINTVHTVVVARYNDITKNYSKLNLAENEFRVFFKWKLKGGCITV